MCTIFAKKSFEDRKNVPASSTGAAQGRATVQQGVVAGSAPAARHPQCDLLSLAGKRHAVATQQVKDRKKVHIAQAMSQDQHQASLMLWAKVGSLSSRQTHSMQLRCMQATQ